MRIEAMVAAVAADRPDRLALICGARRWTYAELRAEFDRRAAVLVAAGTQPGDVVVNTVAPVTDAVAVTFLACCRADLTFLQAPAAPDVGPLIARSGARFALTADGTPHPDAPQTPALPLDLPGDAEMEDAREAARRSAAGDDTAIAILMPTSGTTGSAPKLARQPHRLYTWQVATPALRRSWWEDPDGVYIRPRSSYFSARDYCEMLGLGGTHVFATTNAPDALEAEMATHGATILGAVPATVHLLVEQERPNPTGLRLRFIRTGAAYLPDSVGDAAARRYGAMTIQEYGSSEGGAMIGTPRGGAPHGSIGIPYPGVAARIADEAGADVPEGEVGELLIRTPGAMLGYHNDPEATARTLRDGWIWTGDLARRDRDGFYHLEGRRALRISVSGYKVAPEEIEAVLSQHPGVREVAALGAPDAARGEVVRAVIVPHGEPPAIGDLRRFCRARLAPHKVPRLWEFRAMSLPRSPLGKPLRHLL